LAGLPQDQAELVIFTGSPWRQLAVTAKKRFRTAANNGRKRFDVRPEVACKQRIYDVVPRHTVTVVVVKKGLRRGGVLATPGGTDREN
jgi:hypothetical protein